MSSIKGMQFDSASLFKNSWIIKKEFVYLDMEKFTYLAKKTSKKGR
jgi:hypothetical protein